MAEQKNTDMAHGILDNTRVTSDFGLYFLLQFGYTFSGPELLVGLAC